MAVVAFLYFRSLPGHAQADAEHSLKYLYIGFFATGLCARQFEAEILRHRILWSCAGLALLIAAAATGRPDLATWIIVAPLVLVVGSLATPGVRSAGRFGDLSYGIYIYAYFVQQLSVRYWPGTASVAGPLLVSIVVTAGSGVVFLARGGSAGVGPEAAFASMVSGPCGLTGAFVTRKSTCHRSAPMDTDFS